jgi:hypothetical protein
MVVMVMVPAMAVIVAGVISVISVIVSMRLAQLAAPG